MFSLKRRMDLDSRRCPPVPAPPLSGCVHSTHASGQPNLKRTSLSRTIAQRRHRAPVILDNPVRNAQSKPGSLTGFPR